jgi:hypothetical protein
MIDALIYGANQTQIIEKLSRLHQSSIEKNHRLDALHESNKELMYCEISMKGTGKNTKTL